MTLKEKLNEQLSVAFANEIERLAEEFAIGFAEWSLKNYDGIKSVKKLLEIYKKEKGL